MADSRVIQHGTRKRYSKGCRCAGCREAETRYVREYRLKRDTSAPGFPHGTTTGYACGCRCDECREYKRMAGLRQTKVKAGDTGVKHGIHKTYSKGCRCNKCRVAETKYRNKVNKSRDFTAADFPHGEPRGYKGGCRCDACSMAKSDYDKARIQAIDKDAPEYPHGTRLGARNGCRCEPCMDAKRNHEKAYRKEKMGKSPDFREKRRLSGRLNMAKRRERIGPASKESGLIRKIYEHCPDGYQVDHIVPLSVNGKHEPDNLQYLPAKVNNIKKNRLDFDCSEHVIHWQTLFARTLNDHPERE